MRDFASAREQMVERQIAARGLADPMLLDAFRAVPRELFVGPSEAAAAYDDSPLPIAADQTISQPYIVALMIAEAGVGRESVVLEVGAGSGYAAAVISRIAARVVAIERQGILAQQAAERVERLGYRNLRILHGDGMRGCPDEAPFDAIIVSAAAVEVPRALCAQLRIGGRLVLPVGAVAGVQELLRITREGSDEYRREQLGPVRFVPLLGGTEEAHDDGRSAGG